MGHGIDDASHGELRPQQTGRERRNGPECHEVLGCVGTPLHETAKQTIGMHRQY